MGNTWKWNSSLHLFSKTRRAPGFLLLRGHSDWTSFFGSSSLPLPPHVAVPQGSVPRFWSRLSSSWLSLVSCFSELTSCTLHSMISSSDSFSDTQIHTIPCLCASPFSCLICISHVTSKPDSGAFLVNLVSP